MSSGQKISKRTADFQLETIQRQNRSSDLSRITFELNMKISITKTPNGSRLSEKASSN